MNVVFNTLTHSYLGGVWRNSDLAQFFIYQNHTADKP